MEEDHGRGQEQQRLGAELLQSGAGRVFQQGELAAVAELRHGRQEEEKRPDEQQQQSPLFPPRALDLRSQRKHQGASRLLHAGRSLQPPGLQQRHQRQPQVQLRGQTPGAHCQVPASLTERSGTEELHEHSGASGSQSSGGAAERARHQGAAADAAPVSVPPGAGHGQVGAGGEHQHVGAAHGQHQAVAAAAPPHPHPHPQAGGSGDDTDPAAPQSAAQHHAASVGRPRPAQPGTGQPRPPGPHRGPTALEEAVPVPLHRQTDPEAADGVGEGSPGVEEDVLQAEPLLSSQGAVQRHAAPLYALPHPLLEGHQSSVYGQQPRELHHAALTAGFHRPLPLLIPHTPGARTHARTHTHTHSAWHNHCKYCT